MKENHTSQGGKFDCSSDWVCLNCSNLNYSFRKICNRCRSITRQQNHQNYLQMQYLQIYYQQPYSSTQDNSHNSQSSPKNNPYADSSKMEEINIISRKQSSQGSQFSDLSEKKSVDWNNSETQGKFLFLLDNAWEGLYCKNDVSEFKTCEEIENTREQEEPYYDNEDVLTNLDFTFI